MTASDFFAEWVKRECPTPVLTSEAIRRDIAVLRAVTGFDAATLDDLTADYLIDLAAGYEIPLEFDWEAPIIVH